MTSCLKLLFYWKTASNLKLLSLLRMPLACLSGPFFLTKIKQVFSRIFHMDIYHLEKNFIVYKICHFLQVSTMQNFPSQHPIFKFWIYWEYFLVKLCPGIFVDKRRVFMFRFFKIFIIPGAFYMIVPGRVKYTVCFIFNIILHIVIPNVYCYFIWAVWL